MSAIKRWAVNRRDIVVNETYWPWRKDRGEADAEEQRQHEEDLAAAASAELDPQGQDENDKPKTKKLGKYGAIVAAGTGLFSDGYVNNSIGSVNTILGILYPKEYANSPAQRNVASIAFAGTVVGQLGFGYFADHYSRKVCILLSTLILIVFTILAAGAWGAGGSVAGMLAALTAYRFFIGTAIGGEYAAGSSATAEATQALSKGSRNRWFVFFTNFMIDSGYVVSAFTPLVLLWICGTDHLTPVWRVTLGLGAIPPLSLFYLRTKFEDSEQFKKNNLKTNVPYWLALKYYWPRLVVVSLIWFIYDFSAYSFGIFSSAIINEVVPGGDMYKTFGWNVVLNLFYIPGSFLGAILSDVSPRLCLVFGLTIQAIFGFAMAANYETLKQNIAGFVVVYGIFMSCGELGPGDQIGLVASKTSASGIRAQYYGVCAAMGKIGAFVGTYLFNVIIDNSGTTAAFYVSSALCLLSACLALFCLPALGQDAVDSEDVRFREYLEQNGYDISQMGSVETITSVEPTCEKPSVSDGSINETKVITNSNEKHV